MSVLIKGVTTPDMCSECYFLSDIIFPNGIYVCEHPSAKMYAKNVTEAARKGVRDLDCPFSKLPESHGPLIDRNKLCESLDLSIGIVKNINDTTSITDNSDLISFIPKIIERVYKSIRDDLVLKMPVVVEAEGELLKARNNKEL